jgi:preprotein translocase subunit SecF
VPFELVPPGTNIDFLGRSRLAAALSIGLLLVSLGAAFVRGVNWGVDFAGGNEVQFRFAEGVAVDEGLIREAVSACGAADASVVRFGGGQNDFLVKFGEPSEEQMLAGLEGEGCRLSGEEREELRARLAESGGADRTGQMVHRLELALGRAAGPVTVERVEFVGPKVGAELRRDGLISLTIANVLILLYVALRFNMRFAPGAVIALIHDVSVTAGVFVIFGLEFDLTVLAALLAILGYSVNDTVVIYDRIRENASLRTKHDLEEMLNRSLNQTLSRTVLTSGFTLLAVLALLVVGGPVIRPFALAMTIGIGVGTYSTLYIATPIVLWLERRAGRVETGRGAESQRPPRSPAQGKGRRARA